MTACFIMTARYFLFRILANSTNSSAIVIELLVRIRVNMRNLFSKGTLKLVTVKIQHRQTLPKRGIPSTLTPSGKWPTNCNNKSIVINHKLKIMLLLSNCKTTGSNCKKLKNNSKVFNISKNKSKRLSSKHDHESIPSAPPQLNKMKVVKKLPKRINSQIKINRSQ